LNPLFVLKFIFSLANPNIFLSTCKGGSSKQKENARPNEKKGKKKKKKKKEEEEENTQAENAHDENEEYEAVDEPENEGSDVAKSLSERYLAKKASNSAELPVPNLEAPKPCRRYRDIEPAHVNKIAEERLHDPHQVYISCNLILYYVLMSNEFRSCSNY
jgi:hypothetical protein